MAISENYYKINVSIRMKNILDLGCKIENIASMEWD
jgi:hypothetical protein